MSRRSRTRLHRHRTFGLVLQSDLRLPLPAAPGGSRADLRFRLLPPAEPSDPPVPLETFVERKDGSPLVSWGRVGGGVLLRCAGSGDFQATAALGRVTCRPVPGAGGRDLASLLVDNILPLLLAWRGEFVLHASAVRVGGGAVAFVGPRGAGKSTLAAALGRLGHPVLADDALLLRLRRGLPEVVPGPPSVRLGERTLHRVLGRRGPAGGAKTRVGFEERTTEPVPLRRIFLLDPGDRRRRPVRFVVHPLPWREALMGIVESQFLLDRSNRTQIRDRFNMSELIVRNVLVSELSVPFLGPKKSGRPGVPASDILSVASGWDN